MLILAALGIAGAAQAGGWDDRYETQSIVVPASDLDLSTSAGIATLYHRVDNAVDRICGDDRDCREMAWESTEDQASAHIAHDKWMRRLAEERLAELRACGRRGCRPEPVVYPSGDYPPQSQRMVVAPGTRVTVRIVTQPPPIPYMIP